MIFLVRHGEAAASWAEHSDPGLSETGRAQADAVAQKLADLGAAHAFTSPMLRCRETAAPFERFRALHARIEPSVSEIPTPDGIGDRADWLRQVLSGTWAQAGEELLAWREELLGAISDLPENTAVFTHFVAINAIAGALEGIDRCLVFRPGHASVTRLEPTGSGLVVLERGAEADSRVL